MGSYLAAALTIVATLWAVTLVAAPLALVNPSAAPVTVLVYQGCSRICHQRPERSFRVAGVQQPVCARCFGLYVSAAVGFLAAWAFAPRGAALTRRTRVWLAVAALPTAATFLIEAAAIARPSSAVRALAALPLGAVAAWIVASALRAERNAL